MDAFDALLMLLDADKARVLEYDATEEFSFHADGSCLFFAGGWLSVGADRFGPVVFELELLAAGAFRSPGAVSPFRAS